MSNVLELLMGSLQMRVALGGLGFTQEPGMRRGITKFVLNEQEITEAALVVSDLDELITAWARRRICKAGSSIF